MRLLLGLIVLIAVMVYGIGRFVDSVVTPINSHLSHIAERR